MAYSIPEPVLISIAATLAGRSVVGLYKLVKKKFSDDPEATAVLEAAEGAAEDTPGNEEAARKTGPVWVGGWAPC
jgi:hypothetical protein